ncbi:hypothetical protein [Sorangium sp. So ce124]|uniref:hypothetical protein n=1 Tax=Sorangium sp. So ce124 TaxID=3133280 RepID=UPI003F6011C8
MTHCLTGTLGKIRSTSVAASSHIRREAQLGQGPRSLHEKAATTHFESGAAYVRAACAT